MVAHGLNWVGNSSSVSKCQNIQVTQSVLPDYFLFVSLFSVGFQSPTQLTSFTLRPFPLRFHLSPFFLPVCGILHVMPVCTALLGAADDDDTTVKVTVCGEARCVVSS